MTVKGPSNLKRSFGVSVGLVLCAIPAVLWWHARLGRAGAPRGGASLACRVIVLKSGQAPIVEDGSWRQEFVLD